MNGWSEPYRKGYADGQADAKAEHEKMCETCIHKVSAEDIKQIRADAIREFAEWFDKDYEIYQKYIGGYCEVKVSTTLHRYFKQIKEKRDE